MSSRSPQYPGRAVRGAVLAFGLVVLASPRATAEAPLALAPERLERAWWAPAVSLEARVARVRAAADAIGIVDVEPLARALLIDASAGTPLARAAAAVQLAPGLPAAQLALARAEWEDGAGVRAAARAAGAALASLPRHLESRLWFEATVLTLAFAAVLGAGLLWIAARGLLACREAAHDLAHRIGPNLPDFAKAAAMAVLILAPAALGEGLLGVGLALFALAWWAGDGRQRRALAAAALLVVLALGPLASVAGRALGAFSADPVVLAAVASEGGWLDPVAALRLERASAAGDPLAMQAVARRLRRSGDLAGAAELCALLLAKPDAVNASVLNDAAHVELLAGRLPAAIDLYRRAIEREPSADLWFNLAQAHMRAIDIDQHGAALAAAQALDAERAGALTQRLGASQETLVDLPLDASTLRARLRAGADPAAGAALRAKVAPGVLGRWPWLAGIGFAALAALATALARLDRPSRPCVDCGTRLCAHCRTGEPSEGLCAACARRQLEARHGGPWEPRGDGGAPARWARGVRSARRFVPGLLERDPARPGWTLTAWTALTAAGLLWVGRSSVIVDPAAVGVAGPLAVAALAAALGASGIAMSVWARRKGVR